MNLCMNCLKIVVDKRLHTCPTPEESKSTKDLSKDAARNPEVNQPIQHK